MILLLRIQLSETQTTNPSLLVALWKNQIQEGQNADEYCRYNVEQMWYVSPSSNDHIDQVQKLLEKCWKGLTKQKNSRSRNTQMLSRPRQNIVLQDWEDYSIMREIKQLPQDLNKLLDQDNLKQKQQAKKIIGTRKGIGIQNCFIHMLLKENGRIEFKKFKRKIVLCLRMRCRFLRPFAPITWSCSLPLLYPIVTLLSVPIMLCPK